LVAIAPGRFFDRVLVAAADRNQPRDGDRWVHDVGNLLEGVAVRLAHEGIAQQPDPDLRRVMLGFGSGHAGESDFLGHVLLLYPSPHAASNATSDGLNSVLRMNSTASFAPCSRSMPLSSHSTESGPS